MKNKQKLIEQQYNLFFALLKQHNSHKQTNLYEYDEKSDTVIVKIDFHCPERKVNSQKDYIDLKIPHNIIFEKSVNLNIGYNIIFGENTYIKKNLLTNFANDDFSIYKENDKIIKIKSLGKSLKVKTLLLENVSIDNFPDYLHVHDFTITNNFGEQKLNKRIIVDGDFYMENLKSIEGLEYNGASTLDLTGTDITKIPENLLKNNHLDNEFNVKIILDFLKNKSIKLPDSFKSSNVNIEIHSTGTFIENSHEFKKCEKLCFEDPSYEDKYHNVIMNPNELKNNSKNIFDFNNLEDGVFNYIAPHRLYYKLFKGNLENITNDEREYFLKNKKSIEEYKEYDGNNIIFYCRNKQAFDFLCENNYKFNDEELLTIEDKNIKKLYEYNLILQKTVKNKLDIDELSSPIKKRIKNKVHL